MQIMTKMLAKHLCDVLYGSLHPRGASPIPAGQGVLSALHQEPPGGFSHPQIWARAAVVSARCQRCISTWADTLQNFPHHTPRKVLHIYVGYAQSNLKTGLRFH